MALSTLSGGQSLEAMGNSGRGQEGGAMLIAETARSDGQDPV